MRVFAGQRHERRAALNRLVLARLVTGPGVARRAGIDERPLPRRLRREPTRAVVHPDHEPVIGRGDDIEVPIAIDVCGDDVMRVEVIERRDLPREGAGVCRPRRKGR